MANRMGSALVVVLIAALMVSHTRALWDREFVTMHIPEISCVGCTLMIGVVEGYATSHNTSIEDTLDYLCGILPAEFRTACTGAINDYGAVIIEMLENKETPDAVCRELQQCINASAQCQLFPAPTTTVQRPRGYYLNQHLQRKLRSFNPIEWLIAMITNTVNSHKPWFDADKDLFGETEMFRGWNWRGDDCNDDDATIYPGRKQTSHPAYVDHNCNGINGTAANGTSWESLLCNVTQYSYVVIGDSASAHFHLPPQWLNGSAIVDNTYIDVLNIAANEVDWPMMSATTGFMTSPWSGAPPGPVDSLYLRGRAQNLCSHRDYQNIAVNGARAGAVCPPNGIINSFVKHGSIDQPAMVSYALIGNDVCNGHHTTDNYTPYDDFKAEVLSSLAYLNDTLAPGSHVTFIGLVDGRVLWNTMNGLYHPISANRKDVTYADVYDYLNCLGISPCYGWLNSNETIRNITSAWAAMLNTAYVDIIANYSFANFDMNYLEYPIAEILQQWVADGGEPSELIEPVDGFHPSQITHALLAEYIWNWYKSDYPQYIPPLNPNNALIAQLFGDQGGYSTEGPSKKK